MAFSSISASTLITFSKIIKKQKNSALPKFEFHALSKLFKIIKIIIFKKKTENHQNLNFSIFRLSENEQATNFPAKRSIQPQRIESILRVIGSDPVVMNLIKADVCVSATTWRLKVSLRFDFGKVTSISCYRRISYVHSFSSIRKIKLIFSSHSVYKLATDEIKVFNRLLTRAYEKSFPRLDVTSHQPYFRTYSHFVFFTTQTKVEKELFRPCKCNTYV